MENIVCTDFVPKEGWEFLRALEACTGMPWRAVGYNNSGLRKGRASKIGRLSGYVAHAFGLFVHRGKYRRIVAWQQFYGLFFAFFSQIFRVKKRTSLIVMTFIYKEKKGLAGKLYRKFVRTAVCSDYVDALIVFSRHEEEYYAEKLGVGKEKFFYLPLGTHSEVPKEGTALPLPEKFFLSVGRSNRDYDFLAALAPELPLPVVVLSDSWRPDAVPENLILLTNVGGEEYRKVLAACFAVLIPLDDPDISAGQLVMLQAMQFEKPLVVTQSRSAESYLQDGWNALVPPKQKQAFLAAARRLAADGALYGALAKNGLETYVSRHSLAALGTNVGKVVLTRGAFGKDNAL